MVPRLLEPSMDKETLMGIPFELVFGEKEMHHGGDHFAVVVAVVGAVVEVALAVAQSTPARLVGELFVD